MDGHLDANHFMWSACRSAGRQNISQLCQIQRYSGCLNSHQTTRPDCNTLDYSQNSNSLDYSVLSLQGDQQRACKGRAQNKSGSGAPPVLPAKLPRITDGTELGLIRERSSYPGLLRGAVGTGEPQEVCRPAVIPFGQVVRRNQIKNSLQRDISRSAASVRHSLPSSWDEAAKCTVPSNSQIG